MTHVLLQKEVNPKGATACEHSKQIEMYISYDNYYGVR